MTTKTMLLFSLIAGLMGSEIIIDQTFAQQPPNNIGNVQTQLDEHEQRIETLEGLVDFVQGRINQIQTQVDDLIRFVDDYSQRIVLLEGLSNNHSSQLGNLWEDKAEQWQYINNNTGEIGQLKDRVDFTEKEINRHQRGLEDLWTEIQIVEGTAEQAKGVNWSQQQEIDDLTYRLDTFDPDARTFETDSYEISSTVPTGTWWQIWMECTPENPYFYEMTPYYQKENLHLRDLKYIQSVIFDGADYDIKEGYYFINDSNPPVTVKWACSNQP